MNKKFVKVAKDKLEKEKLFATLSFTTNESTKGLQS